MNLGSTSDLLQNIPPSVRAQYACNEHAIRPLIESVPLANRSFLLMQNAPEFTSRVRYRNQIVNALRNSEFSIDASDDEIGLIVTHIAFPESNLSTEQEEAIRTGKVADALESIFQDKEKLEIWVSPTQYGFLKSEYVEGRSPTSTKELYVSYQRLNEARRNILFHLKRYGVTENELRVALTEIKDRIKERDPYKNLHIPPEARSLDSIYAALIENRKLITEKQFGIMKALFQDLDRPSECYEKFGYKTYSGVTACRRDVFIKLSRALSEIGFAVSDDDLSILSREYFLRDFIQWKREAEAFLSGEAQSFPTRKLNGKAEHAFLREKGVLVSSDLKNDSLEVVVSNLVLDLGRGIRTKRHGESPQDFILNPRAELPIYNWPVAARPGSPRHELQKLFMGEFPLNLTLAASPREVEVSFDETKPNPQKVIHLFPRKDGISKYGIILQAEYPYSTVEIVPFRCIIEKKEIWGIDLREPGEKDFFSRIYYLNDSDPSVREITWRHRSWMVSDRQLIHEVNRYLSGERVTKPDGIERELRPRPRRGGVDFRFMHSRYSINEPAPFLSIYLSPTEFSDGNRVIGVWSSIAAKEAGLSPYYFLAAGSNPYRMDTTLFRDLLINTKEIDTYAKNVFCAFARGDLALRVDALRLTEVLFEKDPEFLVRFAANTNFFKLKLGVTDIVNGWDNIKSTLQDLMEKRFPSLGTSDANELEECSKAFPEMTCFLYPQKVISAGLAAFKEKKDVDEIWKKKLHIGLMLSAITDPNISCFMIRQASPALFHEHIKLSPTQFLIHLATLARSPSGRDRDTFFEFWKRTPVALIPRRIKDSRSPAAQEVIASLKRLDPLVRLNFEKII